MIKKALILATLAFLPLGSYAASVDGSITTGEYEFNTTMNPAGSDKWNTFTYNGTNNEYNDASGGDNWDINYLGTTVSNGKFEFGAIGGEILSGRQTGSGGGVGIFLSDFALGFNTTENPTTTSNHADFKYAIRLISVEEDNNGEGVANFELLSGGTWVGSNIYNNSNHITETYQMTGATSSQSFTGQWNNNGGDDNVLEANFDLAWLGLFDLNQGGRLSTYLTMACVNDEAMVHANVAPSAVPIPAAALLFGPALFGFMGLRRRLSA